MTQDRRRVRECRMPGSVRGRPLRAVPTVTRSVINGYFTLNAKEKTWCNSKALSLSKRPWL